MEGTRIILEKAREAGVSAFVYTSSADVVKGHSWQDLVNVNEDTPIPEKFDNAYGRSKVGSCCCFLSIIFCFEHYLYL